VWQAIKAWKENCTKAIISTNRFKADHKFRTQKWRNAVDRDDPKTAWSVGGEFGVSVGLNG